MVINAAIIPRCLRYIDGEPGRVALNAAHL